MLVRLLPEQINPYWEQIKTVIREGSQLSNPTSEEELTNVLQSVYDGGLTCWISGNKEGINGIVITFILEDNTAKIKSLVIYFAYHFGSASKEDWIDAINSLKQYAKSINCHRIVAHPYEKEVLSLCEKLGGRLTNYVVEFDLEPLNGNK